MPNQLATQSSPYLLQHAENPVQWYPWGDAALKRAAKENKPILLSIGYSACHWCHVMAHESFEDPETAALMNELYINIKVDREERPDLDKVYQLAHTAITRRGGGWPLTMFLTPDQVPFFGGTYFPKQSRYGLPAFKEILVQVATFLTQNPNQIQNQNQSLLGFFNSLQQTPTTIDVSAQQLLAQAATALEQAFDTSYGGFGDAPKFPQSSNIELALRLAESNADPRLLHIAQFSLQKMFAGGLYDQLGGGFFRYSVDAQWQIPHFEKMLYDNGLLLNLYCQTWQVSREPLFKKAINQTIQWLLEEMRDAEGGFYAALDADSEGEEGRFYYWDKQDIESHVEPLAYSVIVEVYGLTGEPNFEGHWHLNQCNSLDAVAAKLGLSVDTATELLDKAHQQLRQQRAERIRPELDNKILTAWNAMVIKGLASAAIYFNRDDWAKAASTTFQFIQQHLWQNDRLLAVRCNGESKLAAYLDDYAYLLDATISLLQCSWDPAVLQFAECMANALIDRFQDNDTGHFYFTAHDHEHLIHRPISHGDESTPSGAMIASRALLQIGYLLANNTFLTAAERGLQAALPDIPNAPLGYATALLAMLESQQPPTQIILRGEEPELNHWQQTARQICKPWVSIYAIHATERNLPFAIAEKTAQSRCTAYLCQGAHCLEPISDFENFKHTLSNLDDDET